MDNPSQKKNLRKKPLPVLPMELQGRIPPNSRELEEAVLGAMMLEREKITQVIDILSEKHFYVPENQYVFRSIRRLIEKNQAVDLLTVNNDLRNFNELEMAGGSYYLAQLSNRVASAANIEFHARILTQKYVQRELIRVSGEIVSEAYDDSEDPFEMLDNSERKLYEIKNSSLKRSFLDISTLISRALKQLEEKSGEENDGITGVAAGFTDLDRVTGGWQPSDLIILAARPAMGKTAFALSLLRNAAVDFGKSVMMFSLEMSDVQLVNRLISAETQISSEKIKKSSLDDAEWERMHAETTKLGGARIFIDDTPQLSIFDLNAKCRRVHSQHGLDLVVVDYLQLLRHDAGHNSNREQEIAFISRSLKGLAKELNIPIIALAQLSREVEKRANKRPMLSDLRESGSIEQDADMVLFMYRDEYYTSQGNTDQSQESGYNEMAANIKGLTEVIIGKNRHGPVGIAHAKFIADFSKFVDLDPVDRQRLSKDNNYDQAPSYSMVSMQSKMNVEEENPLDGFNAGNWDGDFSAGPPNIIEE